MSLEEKHLEEVIGDLLSQKELPYIDIPTSIQSEEEFVAWMLSDATETI